MKNIFSIDVEDWYHLNFSSVKKDRLDRVSRIEKNFPRLLELFDQFNAKATFFFLGSIAEQFPYFVNDASNRGHEIASHGYSHELVYQQTEKEFIDDVAKSRDILQSITNKRVLGYRAPSWSISKQTPWAYDALAKLGFKYDASLFPFDTFLYGDGKAPIRPYIIKSIEGNIIEVPMSILEVFNIRVPFSGGFYLRFLPFWTIKIATNLVNRRKLPVIFYLHPREIDPGQPHLKLPFRDYFISYFGIKGTEGKVKKILQQGSTTTIADFLSLTMIR